jgi:phenylalanyl-tRNA synthetase beta chain
MLISLKWLAEYVDLPPAEELARRLTAVGLEVEAVERVGAELEGVVAARIVAAEKHPSADRLSLTRVDAGTGEPLQVICGASNWKVGDVVPLATVGARLPGGLEIQRAKLRGVDSFGMLCSSKELGLSADATGLLILPGRTKPGTPVARALELEDVIFDVNVTPNRPDALSHIGIAREVAALAGRRLRHREHRPKEGGGSARDAVRVRIEAPERCPRYAARVIEGVRIGPAPPWLARRIASCGVRSISNVVDATNFALLELGHPLHAFDLDRVAGSEIVVRTARPGETLTTLDGEARRLDPDDLVIADRERASALAGIMGGGDSEISAGTTRVLLESAWFAPAGIRRTARRHGLHTEASHRFERGADPGMVIAALDRCAALIAELGGGTVRRGAVDAHPRPIRPAAVPLAWSRPGEVLGIPVPRQRARRILENLGFELRRSTARGAIFRAPSWRADVALEEDLIEEIARTVGYDAIPETLPAASSGTAALAAEAQVADGARRALEAAGFSEAVNFSFVAPRDLALLPPGSGAGPAAIALKNPISADLAVMRTSLVPSLLRNVGQNLRQRVEEVRLYELASSYHPPPAGYTGDLPAREEMRLAAVAFGRRSPRGWAAPTEPFDLFDLKSVAEGVIAALGISGVEWAPGGESWLHPRSSFSLEVRASDEGREVLLTGGEIHPLAARAFDLPRGVFAFEASFAGLCRRARLVPAYRPLPRFPAVLRDLAVVVDEAVPAERVLAVVRAEPLVEHVDLFDVYRGAPLAAGKKNLAMSIRYRAEGRTLTDLEADAAHGRIVARLAAGGAELRA